MKNFGMEYADERIAAVRKGDAAIYRDAAKIIRDGLEVYNKKYTDKDKQMQEKLKRGEISENEYKAWIRLEVYRGKDWQKERDRIAETMYEANSETIEQANAEAPKVFSYGANSTSYLIEKDFNADLGLVAIGFAVAGTLYKKRKVNKQKDKEWNARNIENTVTNTVLRGGRIGDVQKDITFNIVKRNKEETEREVAEYVGGATSAGTLEAMREADERGIGVMKLWIATLDRKTRDTHAELDGQIREIDEPFEVGTYEIMYPRDPEAEPEMRCNCRCDMGWEYKDYPSESMRRENIRDEEGIKPIIEDMDYWEWLEWKGFEDGY